MFDLSPLAAQSSSSTFIDPALNVRRRFFEELTGLLETLVVYSCPIVVGGDFNLRVHDSNSTDARQLANLLLSFVVWFNMYAARRTARVHA